MENPMQRVIEKRSRSRLAITVLILVLAAVGLTWALTVVSEAWRNAVIAAAGAIAASATTWAAYEARRAAMASASSARDARLALALHNRPWPHINLVRENGVEGAPWKWYVSMSSQSAAVQLRLTWTLDGQSKFTTHERLIWGEIWEQATFFASCCYSVERRTTSSLGVPRVGRRRRPRPRSWCMRGLRVIFSVL